jgi:DNA-binding response OmpR family regulator
MKKVLVIDDDQSLQKVFKKLLSQSGFKVIQTFEGREALATIKNQPPDLIVLDIMLPGGINGFDVLLRLKNQSQTAKIPVMILTNLGSEKKTAQQIGVVDYLVKAEVPVEKVVKKIEDYLTS